jgi:hypothetical protein
MMMMMMMMMTMMKVKVKVRLTMRVRVRMKPRMTAMVGVRRRTGKRTASTQAVVGRGAGETAIEASSTARFAHALRVVKPSLGLNIQILGLLCSQLRSSLHPGMLLGLGGVARKSTCGTYSSTHKQQSTWP